MIENVACFFRLALFTLSLVHQKDTVGEMHLLPPYRPTCLDSTTPLILGPASNAHVEICEATLAQAMRESELGLPVMVRAQPPPG